MASVILPPEQRAQIQAAIAAEGLAALVERSGSSERAVLRAASGVAVRRGTAALLLAAVGEAEAR